MLKFIKNNKKKILLIIAFIIIFAFIVYNSYIFIRYKSVSAGMTDFLCSEYVYHFKIVNDCPILY